MTRNSPVFLWKPIYVPIPNYRWMLSWRWSVEPLTSENHDEKEPKDDEKNEIDSDSFTDDSSTEAAEEDARRRRKVNEKSGHLRKSLRF